MMPSSTESRFFSKISRQTLLFFFHNFFINVGTTLVYVSANVLLLENHPESSLPIAYILAAFAVMGAGKIYAYFEHHLLLERLSLGTMLSSLFMVLIVMGLLWIGHGIATAIAIMVGYRIIYLLINLEFWGLSALVFDVRQSKRLFSIIGSGDMPAKALGAVLAVLIHSPSVLMILLVISLAFFVLAFYTQRLTFKYTEVPNPHHARPRQSGIAESKIVQKYFGGNKLVTALCLGIIFIAAAATWIEYHFFVNVKYKFHSQHDVIVFVGSLLTATYLISTLVKILFSGKAVERFGVRLTLYLLPLATVLISLGLIVSSYFRTDEPSLLVYYCIAYLLFELIRRTLFDPVFLVLFQPLSTKNRLKGHTLAKGLYEPLGMLIAGVLLWIVYTMKWTNIGLTFDLSLLFALAALYIFRKAYRQYIIELQNAISKRFLKSGEMASPAEALPIIVANLKSDRKEEVINAIEWLDRYKPALFPKQVDALLTNPSETVRLKTLETLHRMKKPVLSDWFYAYIETETNTPCQTLAVRIACATQKLSEEKIANYLAHRDLDIVKGAILGCWDAGTMLPLMHGTLRKLLNTPGNPEKRTALDCMKEVGMTGNEDAVRECLKDPDPRIRIRAIEVVGAKGPGDLITGLGEYLGAEQYKIVIMALGKSGQSGAAVLAKMMAENPTEKQVRAFLLTTEKHPNHFLLLILIEFIKSIYQEELLVHTKLLNHITLRIHQSALHALSNYTLMPDQVSIIEQFVEKELVHAQHLLTGMAVSESDQPWQQALAYELQLTNQRLFYLFMLLYDKEPVRNAWKGIKHASKEKRANSLEMIESLLPRALYPCLKALFEDIPLIQKRDTLSEYLGIQDQPAAVHPYVIHQNERYFTSWTIALAIQRWQLTAQDGLTLQAFLNHPVRLIREAAQQKLSTQNDLLNLSDTTMSHDLNSQQITEMERVIVLKNTQLFSQTPENVLSSIAPIMREVTFPEGHRIFEKGDLGDSMYIIYAGEIGIYDGPKQLALFAKGEIFGELALLDTEPRSASTLAESDVLLFRIDQEDFFELMEERDEILRNVLRILCQRIRVQNEKMRLLSNV